MKTKRTKNLKKLNERKEKLFNTVRTKMTLNKLLIKRLSLKIKIANKK